MFSTPEDTEALDSLFAQHPYGDDQQVYIRKGHGFFVLAQSVESAVEVVEGMQRKWTRADEP